MPVVPGTFLSICSSNLLNFLGLAFHWFYSAVCPFYVPVVIMANIGWGWIDQEKANVGKPYDKSSDFTEIGYSDACGDEYKNFTHAAHAMIFCRLDEKLWNLFQKHACVMVSVVLCLYRKHEHGTVTVYIFCMYEVHVKKLFTVG